MRLHPRRGAPDRRPADDGSSERIDAEIEARLARVPEARIHDLDVRGPLSRGEEPFERIMQGVRSVPFDGVFRLRAPFEPVPLYAVLGELGFRHRTERLGAEDWRVWFFRDEALAGGEEPRGPAPREIRADAPCGATPRRRAARDESAPATNRSERETTMENAKKTPDAEVAVGPHLLDVRTLAGPQKHPTIHRMFDALPPGGVLAIVNDHDPRPLFYELQAERAGRFDAEAYRSYEAGDGVWVAVLPTLPA